MDLFILCLCLNVRMCGAVATMPRRLQLQASNGNINANHPFNLQAELREGEASHLWMNVDMSLSACAAVF